MKFAAICMVALTITACGASAESPASTTATQPATSPATEFCQTESKRLPVEFTDQSGTIRFTYSKVECDGSTAKQIIHGEASSQVVDIVALTTEARDSMLESCRIDDMRPYLDSGMTLQPQYVVKLPNGVYVNYVLQLQNCDSF